MKTFNVDVDFYSMELTIKAKTKAEARAKAKKQIARKIKAHINNLYLTQED